MALRPHKAPCLLLLILKHNQIRTNNESLKCEGLKLNKCSGHLSTFPHASFGCALRSDDVGPSAEQSDINIWAQGTSLFISFGGSCYHFFWLPLYLTDPLPLFLSSLSCHNPTCSWPKPPLLWKSLSRPTERVCQHLSTLICPSLSACASACICVCADLTPCAACNTLWGFTRNRG